MSRRDRWEFECPTQPSRDFGEARHPTASVTMFQHDYASIHTARGTVNFPRAHNIAFTNDWSSKRPDLNLIEHLGR